MPELPEVETIARDLRTRLVGRIFADVQVYWPGVIHNLTSEEFRQQLVSQRIVDVVRRGKYLVFPLENQWYLLIHLRMTGQLLLQKALPETARHVHLAFVFDDGSRMHFRDTRKFGRVYLTADLNSILGQLGPEPLASDFDSDALAARLRHRKGMIKPLLLNQRLIAGLGNIYVDEALFAAGIHPCRRANTLGREEIQRLHSAIRAVLCQAIGNRGTTLESYRDPCGDTGGNQRSLAIFRRANQPCPRCGAPIQRSRVGGRGTHFCTRCQR